MFTPDRTLDSSHARSNNTTQKEDWVKEKECEAEETIKLPIMRQLTDAETKTLFDKLANYTGASLKNLLTDTTTTPGSKTPDRFVFRVQKDRVYYVRESLANLATSVARDSLLSLGTCMGKFTKTGKFRLHVTALDVIAPHARYKVWVKGNGEMPFLYGGHVVKAHVGRWSEDCPEHQGVVVLSMNDTPLVSDRAGMRPCFSVC